MTFGFAVGVTCVLVAGAVVFDVIDGLAVVIAGLVAPVLVRLVRGANGLDEVPAVVDVIGRLATPPSVGCLTSLTPPRDGLAP